MGLSFTEAEFETARETVYAAMAPTPQYAWPLLAAELGCEVWVKHENHTPTGAFKVRGGLVHMRRRVERGETNGVITASTGNHGQSIPFAARREGIPVTIVVPENNSPDKNAAMRALGVDLIETGHDFIAAKQAAGRIAAERGLAMIPSFHRELVLGVSTYADELFRSSGELDAVYVPIGLGSGICGTISARDRLGLKTAVIGVVAERANAYELSFAAGRPVATNTSATFAEGMAVREPSTEAVAIINSGAERIVAVSEDQMAAAMRLYFSATHNVAEGAGAGPLAALASERAAMAGKRVGVILSGGNIDMARFATVLGGATPAAG